MLALVVTGWMALAQDEPSRQVTELVTHLVENGKHYGEALPSVSCVQTVHSTVLHRGRIVRDLMATGTLRVQRTDDKDAPFRESYHWDTVNGKPLAEGKAPNLPYFVHGLFANALGFSTIDILKCKNFTLTDEPGATEQRLDFERRVTTSDLPMCATQTPGQRRTVFVDRESGHVVRLFRTIPETEAKKIRDVPYVSVDYSPVPLGAETFWLPARGEAHNDKEEARMLVEYSGCHRYASTVKIIGGTDVVPDTP